MNEARTARERQALEEVGGTRVSRRTGIVLVGVFLATLACVPLLEPMLSDPSGVFEVALDVVPETVDAFRRSGPIAANRVLLAGFERFEEALEDESFLRDWVLPGTQRLLRERLGVGSEEVYLGRDGWLFLRADFEHVTGPGFLEPERLTAAQRRGERAADPLPAILAFHRDLAERGIELVVLPTPVKPTVHPEFLSPGTIDIPLHNPSFEEFVARLEAESVRVLDPAPIFARAKPATDEPLYLRTDTHWTPDAVVLAARELASVLDRTIDWRTPPSAELVRRTASVAGRGDLSRLLEGTGEGRPAAAERTTISRVMTRRGEPWAVDREAEVLLLGDSFTNIFSDAALGWGAGAGLAEQLSFELGRGVDRLAVNAGGSWSARQALARSSATTTGYDRLAGKRVVIYQFATRELSIGDWKMLPLPPAGS